MLPKPHNDLSVAFNELAHACLFSVEPAASILCSVGPELGALPVAFVIEEVSFVLGAVGEGKATVAGLGILVPVAFVEVAVWGFESAEAVFEAV